MSWIRLNGGSEAVSKPERKIVGDTIRFYRVNAEYGCFSNFSPHPIRLKGKKWPTSEHYFQAQKFAGTHDEEEVRQAKSPMIAARMGRSRKRPLRKDWEAAKDSIMHEAVLAKFTQHADLRVILLTSGDSTIVEHTENDAYWGDGGDGRGKNRLGQILMQVREELRSIATNGDRNGRENVKGKFAERLKSTFATLAHPLTPEHGEPVASISVAEARLGLKLPAVLRDYYLLAGRFDRFNRAHNELRRPEQWTVEGGKLVFLEENQCVVFWGVDVGTSPEDDPPVYQAQNVRGRPAEWYLEHRRCSEFLIVMLHLQAVWAGYEFVSGVEIQPEALATFLKGWTSTGMVNQLSAFNREGAAACVLEDKGSSQLYFGGRTEREFELIRAELEAVGVAFEL